MITVSITEKDPAISRAYFNARRALPLKRLENPVDYYQRWEEVYNCKTGAACLRFPNEETYIMFLLRWS